MKKVLTVGCSALALLFVGTTMTTISPANAVAQSYSTYVNVAGNDSGLVMEPTLVLEPTSFDEITAAKDAETKAASVVLTPDANMNVTLNGDTMSLAGAFETYLKGTFIPVVRLDSATVSPFIDWLHGTYNIYDIMAISKDVEVLATLYADSYGYAVNTVYDLTEEEIGAGRYEEWTHIGEANKAGCNILMYSVQPNLPVAVEYVEAMTKVCWAVAETEEEAVEAMAAGCYGVVSSDLDATGSALSIFEKSGFARAQYVAAHRGITNYANEQSKTAIAASANEGATHIELDLQITKDQQFLICHNSDTNATAGGSYYFATQNASVLRNLTLNDYSRKYGDTFPTLEETIELLIDTDIIFIFELKLDAASTLAVDELKAIETLKTVLDKYPEMEGRWFAITFYAPYAEKMREVFPEVPVGHLGGARSGKETDLGLQAWGGGWSGKANMSNCMRNVLRKYNVTLDDMTYDNVTGELVATTNNVAAGYLARGYAQNTWTFDSLLHYTIKCNIATTNAAEKCAMIVKNIGTRTTLTSAELAAGKAVVPCTTYNGWMLDTECEIIVVSQANGKAKVLFYLEQNSGDKANVNFGLYSNLMEVEIAD